MSEFQNYSTSGSPSRETTVRRVGIVAAALVVITAAGVGGVLAAKRANQPAPARAAGGLPTAGSHSAGTSPPSTSAAPTQPATGTPSTAIPKCVQADVKGALGAIKTEDKTHTTTTTVIITNAGSHTCTIKGYGGLEMYAGGDGRPVGVNLIRDPKTPSNTVTLKPGGTATKALAWTSGASKNDSGCSAFVGFISVILPDDTKSIQINGDLGQVCLDGAVNGGAYR